MLKLGYDIALVDAVTYERHHQQNAIGHIL